MRGFPPFDRELPLLHVRQSPSLRGGQAWLKVSHRGARNRIGMPRPSRSCAENVSYAKDIFIRPRESASDSYGSPRSANCEEQAAVARDENIVPHKAPSTGGSAGAPSKDAARGMKRSKPAAASGDERAQSAKRSAPRGSGNGESDDSAPPRAARQVGRVAQRAAATAKATSTAGARSAAHSIDTHTALRLRTAT